MILYPRAKINIGLYITEKRADGYHNLQTIFYPVGLCDALEFVRPRSKLLNDQFTTSGLAVGCPPEENLVMTALRKLREYEEIPFLRIHLHKVIPFGAGLGGGSSDAATLIKGLDRYFAGGLSNDTLKEIALAVGSDCPFFIDGTPVFAEGRGEITTPVEPIRGDYNIIIVKPDIDVSTREAYAGCVPEKRPPQLKDHYHFEISRWRDLISNDFEKSLFRKYPLLGEIKELFYKAGAIYSSMSGSGSSVYGIFEDQPHLPESLRKIVIYSGKL
jgi:4-diphosphocytidyl-2-C-methyl-D-erythritol kinase